MKTGSAEKVRGELIVVGVTKKDTKNIAKIAKGISFDRSIFDEDLKTDVVMHKEARLLIANLGKDITTEITRRLGSIAADYATEKKLKSISLIPHFNEEDHARAFVEGVRLGSYTFDQYKSKKKGRGIERIEILGKGFDKAMKIGSVLAEAINLARDLVNTPANDMTPAKLAKEAQKIKGVKTKVYDEAWLKKNRMGLILAVAKGSSQKPKLIQMDYDGGGKRRYVLVGKGVTFDSGGYNIKPTGYMETMKLDMGGAAAVMATMSAIARLKLPVNVTALVPSVENMVNGKAYRPGDIVRSASGKTVEISNTDAEGRLIMADALHYAKRFMPDYILDAATLTGAALIALGTRHTAIIGTDQELVDQLLEAGRTSGDNAWQLPLLDELVEDTKGDISDVRSLASRKLGAGTSAGAAFLNEFIESKWAHLDIGATAYCENPKYYLKKGATGAGVRIFVQFFMNRSRR